MGLALRTAAWWLLAASLQPSNGAVVRGTIVEARTGAALAAVLVQVVATGQQALSDVDGRFELTGVPLGRQTLVVSVVGYGLVRRDLVVAGDVEDLTIAVAEGASTYVEEVTVAGRALRDAEAGVPAQIVLGSRDLVALRGLIADDPFRAIQVLPGVATGDDFRAEFAVRGQGPRDLGVSIDGIDSSLLFHTVRGVDTTGSLAIINTDILESASLAAGARPLRLGPHLGAAVDFTTREGAGDRLRARGLLSMTAATAIVEGPLGARANWLVAARQSYIDWLIRRIDPDVTDTFGFTDVHAKLSWRPRSTQSIHVTWVSGRSVLQEQENEQARNALDRGTNRTLVASLQWQFVPGSALVISQQVYGVASRYQNKVPDGRVREEGVDEDATWRARIEWAPRDGALVEAGGQVRALRATRLDRQFGRLVTTVNTDLAGRSTDEAAWLHTRWQVSHGLTVLPGARVDRWGLLERAAVSPWLLLEWAVAPETTLRAGASAQAQSPAIDQIVPPTSGGAFRPERARMLDAGVERRLGAAWRVSVNAYHRREDDRLRLVDGEPRVRTSAVIGPRNPYWENALVGNAHGVGVSLERRSANGLSGWLSYSRDRAVQTDRARGEAFPSDYDQRHTLNGYALYRRSSRTSLSTRLRVGSNFPLPGYYQRVGEDYYLADARNTERLPVYGRLDVRGDRTFTYRRSRLTLFAEVVNVMNRRNLRAADPSVSLTTGLARFAVEEMFPVLPSLGVLLEF